MLHEQAHTQCLCGADSTQILGQATGANAVLYNTGECTVDVRAYLCHTPLVCNVVSCGVHDLCAAVACMHA
jgi:hypothetical protein